MEKNSYNMCNDYMNDEIDICDTLKDSDDNICISDLIFEIAENDVPIDENTLYDKVWDAKEDIVCWRGSDAEGTKGNEGRRWRGVGPAGRPSLFSFGG